MLILIAGVVVGLASVIPVGPMSMTVIGVAVQQGRMAGTHAAAGVVAGDLASAGFALVLALAGTQLPGGLFLGLQLASITLLVAVGALLLTRTERLSALAGDLERPGKVLFTLTALSPVTIGSWLAILLASPFVSDPSRLLVFVAGIIVASGLWHPTLAVGAATMRHRLSPRVLLWLARSGGVCMIALAAALAFTGWV
jgi:threonine/homoserine/homoserine lactone efflux protein